MGDSNDCRVFEEGFEESLDSFFGDNIDVGSGFVENDYLTLSHNGTTDADQLLFTVRKVRTSFVNLFVKADGHFGLLVNFLEVIWINQISWIKIISQSSFEENWILWDNCDSASQEVQVKFRNINSIDKYFTREEFNNSTNRNTNCTLT